MQDELAFRPDRRMGLVFHLTLVGVLALAGAAGLWLASQASIGPAYVLYLLPPLAAAVAVPILAYRVYALQTALYILERDGLHLRWGLRSEDIPIDEILWVHPAAELTAPLPLPRPRFPGAVIGKRRIPGDGVVEYMAASLRGLIFIATPGGGYAVSPADPVAFLQAYQRFTEMGSLTSLASRSIYPAFLLQQVWVSVPARALLAACLVLSLALLVWVGLSIPGQGEVHLGFHPDGSPGDLVPAARLLLLPLLNFMLLMVGVFLGLFFFRRDETRPASYLMWSSSALTALLFLLAVFFVLRSS